jgi:hypothetical protein
MTKQVQTRAFAAAAAVAVPVGMLLLAGVQTADAKQCRATMPSNPEGHWTYRLIDDRKCWYEGQSKISKSLLHWSAPVQVRSARPHRNDKRPPPETLTVSTTTGKPSTPSAPSRPDPCCNKQISESESFEARWRPVEMSR